MSEQGAGAPGAPAGPFSAGEGGVLASAGGPSPGGGLRRALGLRSAVSTSAGLAFAAIEYLAIASMLGYSANDAAWVPIAVAGVLMLLVWGCYGELNGLFPTAAAIRLYMSRAMDDRVALGITFTYMTTIVLVIAADAFIIGSALAYALGAPGWAVGVFIVFVLGVAVMSNLRGVRVAGAVQDLATYLVLAATVGIAGAGLLVHGGRLHHVLDPIVPGHGLDLVQAVALGVFLYSAFEWVTASAEEVRSPDLVPKGMGLALGALFVVCALAASAMQVLLDHRQLVSAYPQLYLGRSVAGVAGLWVMVAVTALTALNTFNGGFVTASRFVYAAAREGNLPRVVASLNDRAVPWVPVVGLGAASLAAALGVALTSGWQVLVSMGAALEAMIYAVAGFCVVRLRRRLPRAERPFRLRGGTWLAGASVVVFGLLSLVASVSVANRFDLVPLVLLLVAGAASGGYVVVVLPRLRAKEAARLAAAGGRPRRRPGLGATGVTGPGPGRTLSPPAQGAPPAPGSGPGARTGPGAQTGPGEASVV
jgi:APA family basic amino acid/polyamine antiporter